MITRKIIEAHGGKLEIHSQSKLGGALVKLLLPIKEEF
jgi:nitrogen fixation/metabolism regulation signal transduction histidine kinase